MRLAISEKVTKLLNLYDDLGRNVKGLEDNACIRIDQA